MSTFLRLTPRGMQYSHMPSFFVPDTTNSLNEKNRWQSIVCKRDMYALCVEASSNMALFGSKDSQISVGANDAQYRVKNTYLNAFGGDTACNVSSSNRLWSDSNAYSITLCDLVDAQLDLFIVYEDTENIRVFWRQDNTPTFLLIILAMLSIYLVSCVAQNIVKTISHPKKSHLVNEIPASQRAVTLFVWILLVLDFYTTLLQTAPSNDFFILRHDRVVAIHLLFYVIVELFFQTAAHLARLQYNNTGVSGGFRLHTIPKHYTSSVSILIACLLLISLRIHFTLDNPYLVVLTTLFGIRSWYKFLWATTHQMPEQVTQLVCCAIQVIDMFVFCSLLGNGIVMSSMSFFDASVVQLIIFFIAALVGGLLLLYKEVTTGEKKEDP